MKVKEVEVDDPNVATLDDGSEVRYEDDGVVVDFDPPRPDRARGEDGWYENLAEYMSTPELVQLADRLITLFKLDIESRGDWEQPVTKLLQHLGIKKITTSNSEMTGSSAMNVPVLSEIAQNFVSRSIEELLPAAGPVKSAIVGDETSDRVMQANRVSEYMNYHYMVKDRGYFADSETLLLKAAMLGNCFRHTTIDPKTKKPVQRHVDAMDVVMPYKSGGVLDSPRTAVRDFMFAEDIYALQDSGYYAETPVVNGYGEDTEVLADIADKVDVENREDEIHEMLIFYVDWNLDADPLGDGRESPYMIVIDRTSEVVTRIERKWDPNDDDRMREQCLTQYRYLPGLGSYGMGLIHYLGAFGEAATEALRAIFDSATMSNFPGGFYAKGSLGSLSGDINVVRGKFQEIDIDMDEEEVPLDRRFMKLPIDQPAPALFDAFKEIVEITRRFGSITEIMTGEGAATAPVGTTLARIEQALKVMSGIHKRMHDSLKQDLFIMHRFLRDALLEDGSYPYEIDGDDGQVAITDFDNRVDIIPVSDPNIFSSVQRIAMAQAVYELVTSHPEDFDDKARKAAYRKLLTSLKVDDVDDFVPEDNSSVPHLDPVSENMRAMKNMPMNVHPAQHHEAHMAVHQHFLETQVAMMPPELQGQIMNNVMAHMAEHMAYQYQAQMEIASGVPMLPVDIDNMDEPMATELDTELSLASAQAVKQLQPPPQEEEGPTPEEKAQAAEEQAFIDEQERKQQLHQQKMEDSQRVMAEKAVTEKLKQDQMNEKLRFEKEMNQRKAEAEQQKIEEARQRAEQQLQLEREAFEREQKRLDEAAAFKLSQEQDTAAQDMESLLSEAQAVVDQFSEMENEEESGEMTEQLAPLIETMTAAIEKMSRPKKKKVELEYNGENNISGGVVTELDQE